MKALKFVFNKNKYPPVKNLLIMVMVLCVHSFTMAQLRSDFSAEKFEGCAPVVVQFADLSTGNPTSWAWDLGNGTKSVLQNPAGTYFTPGTYTVKLVIQNSLGKDSIIKTNYITVRDTPTVNLSASLRSGCFPLTTQFTDQSTPGSGTISKWEWDFGDGNISSEKDPVHTYTSAGNFHVSLRITNSFGCVSSKTINSYISISTGTKAQFSNSNPNSCKAPVTINFLNQSTGTGTLSYQWNFGDGATSSQPSPSHTYITEGNFTVNLIVTNAGGCSDTIVKTNLISIGNTKADFEVPAVICQNTSVDFKNTSSPIPGSAAWNFGDGTFSNQINPTKIFSNPGSFAIKMVGNFGACKDSVTKSVTVIAAPVPDFSSAATVSCKAPFTVNFSNASTAGTTPSWDFGDGTTSTENSPAHTFTSEGNFSVTLSVTNASGCKAQLTKKDFVIIKKPVVKIDGLPGMGCVPLTHTFTSTKNTVDEIVGYQWNFGDGNFSSDSIPTHTYTIPGKYDITLTYTTSGGCVDSVKFVSGILAGSKPKADFSANPQNTCAETRVDFTNLSTGGANEYYWSFGDGGSSEFSDPSYRYVDTGYFIVTLIAINNGCGDTLVRPNYIHIKPPVARFRSSQNCNAPGSVTFTDLSLGADTWHWEFGDGSTSDQQNPIHNYAVAGVYTVQLTVTNNETGCAYSQEGMVTVIRELANFKITDSVICKNNPLTFTALNNISSNVLFYTWRMGDGVSLYETDNTITYAYPKAKAYTVTLVVTDINGCVDSVTKPLAIQVDGPTAVFRALENGVCLNAEVNFVDSSYTDGIHKITEWKWDWGDKTSEVDTLPPFKHLYAGPGNYTISLKVTDEKGCTDSIRKPNAIIVSKPVAAFSGDTLSCTTTPVRFFNSSSGPGLTYQWDFGDGATSVQTNPVHLYGVKGSYTVSLTILDRYGCGNTVTKTNYIRIANPVAGFTVSDSITTCPPLVVNFTNTSQEYSKWEWDFGDGTTSLARNPSHFYASAGVFNAVLKVTGPGGCTSVSNKIIRVNGPSGTFNYTNLRGCTPLITSFTAHTTKNTSFIWDYNDGNTTPTADSIVSHTYTIPGKYIPKMILVDAGGCRVAVTGKDTITVLGVKAGFDHNGKILCDSGIVQFNSTSSGNDAITNFTWNFGDGTTSVLQNPTHSYRLPGIYQTSLSITSLEGCRDVYNNPVPVKVSISPKISIDALLGVCIPGPMTFKGIISRTDTSTLIWKWDFANGKTSTLQNPADQYFSSAGNYIITATGANSNGCKDSVQKIIEIYPLPVLTTSPDGVVCLGDAKKLNVSGAQSYTWNPSTSLSCTNCSGPVARPETSITYYVKGTSDKSCVSYDSIYLKVRLPFSIQASKPDTLCIGSSVQLNASGSDLYAWSPQTGLSNPSIATPIASPRETITYRVIGYDSDGCFADTAYIPVKVYPIPVVNAGDDKTINVGKQIEIMPVISNDVNDVAWSPTTDIIGSSYPGIISKPFQTIEYTVNVKNEGGCPASDKVTIFVLCNNANIFIPNTFSPNGDGANDVFFPRGTGLFTIKSLRIFNRWGQVIFEKSYFKANNEQAGWDGTFKGKKLSPDIFVYTMDVVCDNNETLIFKGNVALIK